MGRKPGLLGELLVQGLCCLGTAQIRFSLRCKVNINVFSTLPKNSLATLFELLFT